MTYLLLGALPIEALHIRTLHLLGRIATNKDSILTQIGYRQLSLKDTDSNSWYIYCVKIAGKYCLPQIHDVFDGTVSPSRWRYLVKKTIHDHWEKALLSDAATKSTLAHNILNNKRSYFANTQHINNIISHYIDINNYFNYIMYFYLFIYNANFLGTGLSMLGFKTGSFQFRNGKLPVSKREASHLKTYHLITPHHTNLYVCV